MPFPTEFSHAETLSAEDQEKLLQIMIPKEYDKGEFVFKAEHVCAGLYLIEKGSLGLFKPFRDKEYYQDFYFEGEFATDIVSLSKSKPSEQYLVSLEATRVHFISKDALIGLYKESENFKEFGRVVLEGLLSEHAELSFIRSSLTAKDKYQHIIEKYPQFIQRIPLQYLASYLGMSRETLSRMRGSM